MPPADPVDPAPLPPAEERDFTAYNRAMASRAVRPLAQRAAELAGPGAGRRAVELGCGSGVESRFLAEQGWHVLAVDLDPAAATTLDGVPGVEVLVTDLEELREVPEHHLLLSCVTLPFLRPAAFALLWERIRGGLLPGGVLAVDLFGIHDDWAGGDGTFLDRAGVQELLAGLEVISLEESERDGDAFSGPKHWHTFRVLARQPS